MNIDSIQKYVDEEKERQMSCECCESEKTTYLYICERAVWVLAHICQFCFEMLKDQPDYVMIKKYT